MASPSGPDSPRQKPVLVYLVTQDWYFMSHRVPMARAAQHAGYDVHVITHVDKDGAAIEALGFHVHPVEWRRGSINPFAFFGNISEVRRLYRTISLRISCTTSRCSRLSSALSPQLVFRARD